MRRSRVKIRKKTFRKKTQLHGCQILPGHSRSIPISHHAHEKRGDKNSKTHQNAHIITFSYGALFGLPIYDGPHMATPLSSKVGPGGATPVPTWGDVCRGDHMGAVINREPAHENMIGIIVDPPHLPTRAGTVSYTHLTLPTNREV